MTASRPKLQALYPGFLTASRPKLQAFLPGRLIPTGTKRGPRSVYRHLSTPCSHCRGRIQAYPCRLSGVRVNTCQIIPVRPGSNTNTRPYETLSTLRRSYDRGVSIHLISTHIPQHEKAAQTSNAKILCSSQNLIFTKAARKSSFLRAAPHAFFKTPGAHLHSKGAALPLYGARAILNFMWIEDDKHIPATVRFGVDALSPHKDRTHGGR